jgi:hypothetical protein
MRLLLPPLDGWASPPPPNIESKSINPAGSALAAGSPDFLADGSSPNPMSN